MIQGDSEHVLLQCGKSQICHPVGVEARIDETLLPRGGLERATVIGRTMDDDRMMMSTGGVFCTGEGMTMFMSGFASSLRHRWWRGSSATALRHKTPMCLNLLVDSWTLSSEAKFVWACVGVFWLGVTVEALAAVRRYRNRPGRRLESAMGYGLQLALGYLLMLAAMSYSIEIFASVIAGVILGHYLFRTAPQRCGAAVATDTSCCAGLDEEHGYRLFNDEPESTPPSFPEALGLSIPSMTCESCVVTVQSCLLACDGVRAVKVDLPNKRALVYGSPNILRLFAALDRAGYPSTV